MCDPAGVGPGRWILFLLRFDPSGVGLRLKNNYSLIQCNDGNDVRRHKYATPLGSDYE